MCFLLPEKRFLLFALPLKSTGPSTILSAQLFTCNRNKGQNWNISDCQGPPTVVMHTIKVQTTQNVFVDYPISSIGHRIIAFLLDRLILVAYTVFVFVLLDWLAVAPMWGYAIAIVLPWLFYPLLFEVLMDGQTPGKRVMKIKVVRLDGTPPTVGNYLLRWIFSFLEYYLFSGLIAVIVVAMGGKGQRLGDVVAGTAVVKLTERHEMDAAKVFISPEQDYVPTFSQVIQLTGSDIELVQRALEVNRDHGNPEPVLAVTEKIKALLDIQNDMPPVKFLYTVIKDFNHLTAR